MTDAGSWALTTRARYVVVRREADEHVPDVWRIRLTREQVAAATRGLGLPAGTHHADRRVTAVAPGVADFGALSQALARRARLAGLGVHADIEHVPAHTRTRPRPWLALLGVGGLSQHVGAYATEDEAERAGRAAWEDLVAELDGAPDEPVILRPGPGETGWDVLDREP